MQIFNKNQLSTKQTNPI